MEVDFGAAVLEGGGDVEDEGDEYLAVVVDIAPKAVFANGGETLGELVGFLEDEGDDEASLKVDISEAAVLLDEGEGVEVDIFHAFRCAVLIVEREDDVAEGVDDAASVADADERASLPEETDFVVDAGNDFMTLEVEEAMFSVA